MNLQIIIIRKAISSEIFKIPETILPSIPIQFYLKRMISIFLKE
jgi:hypothetical protein